MAASTRLENPMKTSSKPRVHLIALTLLAAPLSAPASAGGYALVNCHLFNGYEEGIREHVTVMTGGSRIERIVTDQRETPAGLEVIDCEGNFLMPGLIDAHTHLENIDAARRALASGTTTVRTAGVPAYEDIGLRELVRAGALPGPDVVAAGVYVTPDLEDTVLADPRLAALAGGVQDDDQLRLLVDVNADRGVDVIKTRGTERAGRSDTDPREQVYTQHQLRIVVEAAAQHGLPVMVHAHGDEGARAAVEAGARSIEHGTYLSEDTLRLMKERGTWFVPTYITMLEMNEEQYDHVLRLRGAHMVPRLEQTIRAAHRLGVRFATGADNYYDEKSINRVSLEVMYLVRFGLSPFEALQAATSGAAELLLLGDRTGRIEPGFEADLILVPGNPLEDVMALQDVLLVISNGQVALRRIPFRKEKEQGQSNVPE
jgi:imidazolonepropionase-like amidohydrolase